MVSYKALNTVTEAKSSQTGDGVGNRDARQARATTEARFPQTGDGVGNRDARQARATIVFTTFCVPICFD